MKKLFVFAIVALAAYLGGHALTKSRVMEGARAIFEREDVPVEIRSVALETPFFAESLRGTMLVKHRDETFAVGFKTVGNPLYSGKDYHLEIPGDEMAKLRFGTFFNRLLGR